MGRNRTHTLILKSEDEAGDDDASLQGHGCTHTTSTRFEMPTPVKKYGHFVSVLFFRSRAVQRLCAPGYRLVPNLPPPLTPSSSTSGPHLCRAGQSPSKKKRFQAMAPWPTTAGGGAAAAARAAPAAGVAAAAVGAPAATTAASVAASVAATGAAGADEVAGAPPPE